MTREAIAMAATRYRFAGDHCAGRDVLEVACGGGLGLGTLARTARRVIGLDLTPSLLTVARRTYGGRVPLVRGDAADLPFANGSFDAVLCFEAVYYFPDPAVFLREAHRVLRADGVLLLCSVNPDWLDFNPSPYSYRYPPASEIWQMLRNSGFAPTMMGAFPAQPRTGWERIASSLKRFAVRRRLIPSSMRGKALFKRLFLGPLASMPGEIDPSRLPSDNPVVLDPTTPTGRFKILYAVGSRL